MATKKTAKKSAAMSKPMIALGIIIFIAGAIYLLWQNGSIELPKGLTAIISEVTGESGAQTPVDAAPLSTGGVTFPADAEVLRVYSFNIQIFGESKMKKAAVVQVLVDIVSHADVVAVQEVRSKTDEPVKQFMALLPAKYNYVLGPREGRTSSKEQYWVIYDTEKLEVLDSATFDDADDRFQRSPMGVYFQTKDQFDFILIDNHIEPGSAAKEIGVLPEVITYFQKMWNETDVLVVGDFNADGGYYNEKNLAAVFPEPDYQIILTNEYDTTVAVSDNTYDRFIITQSAKEDYANNFGVIYYDKIYDFESLGIEPKAVSDHYPIWAEFYIDRDTD
jgi:endonuclease/exonuclease/phosphatase family metal-dependent hydrolase